MEFRKSIKSDIPQIMKIIHQAQDYFKQQGIDQWQNNYPNEEIIAEDIANNCSYVMVLNDKIIATVVISFDHEQSYEYIDGKWLTKNKCGIIHRIAIDNNYKGMGLSYKLFNFAEKTCLNNDIHSIKVDTHEENKVMQNTLKKNGFEYCGVIYLEDNAKRVAFEKIF